MSRIYNFISGEWEELPEEGEGPSQWWVEGWDYYMCNGVGTNPYEQSTTEFWEWQDGYEEAQRD